MVYSWLILIVLIGGLFVPTAQQGATVTVHVRDSAGQPVAKLMVHVANGGGTVWTLHTDAEGNATAQGVRGDMFSVRGAQTSDGRMLTIDPTSPDRGLTVRIIPDGEQTINLMLDNDTLFLDPEDIFSGTDPDAPIAAISPSIAAGTPTAHAPATPTLLSATAWQEPSLPPLDLVLRDKLNEPSTRATLEACAASPNDRSQAECAALLVTLNQASPNPLNTALRLAIVSMLVLSGIMGWFVFRRRV